MNIRLKNNLIQVIAFIVNPFAGILLSVSAALNSKFPKACLFSIVFCSLYMAALNSTKVPESDEAIYIEQFKSVPQNGYAKTLKHLSGENDRVKAPLYSTFVYVMYYLTFGHEYFFIAFVSFFIYYLFFYAVYKFQIRCRAPNYIIIAGVLTIVFFTQYFTLTAHLIRQMLATSIFFYSLTFKGRNWKAYGFLFTISYFVHSSMIVLIILSLIPSIDNYYSKKTLIVLSVFAVSTTVLMPSIASFLLEKVFLGESEMGVAVSRASIAEGLKDAGEGISQNLVLLIALPLLFFLIWGILKKTTFAPPIILNLCFIWTIFVMCLSFSPLIQYRFFYILYYYFPFVLFLPFRKRAFLSKVYCVVMCSILIINFFFTYNSSGFIYASPLNALFLPYPILLNY